MVFLHSQLQAFLGTLVAEFLSHQKKVYTFGSLGESGIPKSVKCTHSATKELSSDSGSACRLPSWSRNQMKHMFTTACVA